MLKVLIDITLHVLSVILVVLVLLVVFVVLVLQFVLVLPVLLGLPVHCCMNVELLLLEMANFVKIGHTSAV